MWLRYETDIIVRVWRGTMPDSGHGEVSKIMAKTSQAVSKVRDGVAVNLYRT
jgi:hypothetical protein